MVDFEITKEELALVLVITFMGFCFSTILNKQHLANHNCNQTDAFSKYLRDCCSFTTHLLS
jgi:hypothetical protein